jgi:hypothetical protein
MCIRDSSNGYIGGRGIIFSSDIPNIFKTINGGISWDSMQVPVAEINSMFFINNSKGWLTGELFSGDAIYNSTQGGSYWTKQFFHLYDVLGSIFFIDSLNGWVGSPKAGVLPSFPTIYKTTNSGLNWYDPFRSTNNISYSLYFTSINRGWSAGDRGLIYYTTNSGLNWIAQTPAIQNRIYRSIYFIDSLTGWCAGDSGRILNTLTGGVLTGFSDISSEIPYEYSLSQNYPNPFNPNTIINYQLPMFNFVSLKIFDVLGNEVTTLVNETKPAGSYEVEFDGSEFASGVYFYRLEAGDFKETRRMLLIK